jgi:hypothetical protein
MIIVTLAERMQAGHRRSLLSLRVPNTHRRNERPSLPPSAPSHSVKRRSYSYSFETTRDGNGWISQRGLQAPPLHYVQGARGCYHGIHVKSQTGTASSPPQMCPAIETRNSIIVDESEFTPECLNPSSSRTTAEPADTWVSLSWPLYAKSRPTSGFVP